ncbi:MAG: sugar transferase [Endomicrobiales bacterium]
METTIDGNTMRTVRRGKALIALFLLITVNCPPATAYNLDGIIDSMKPALPGEGRGQAAAAASPRDTYRFDKGTEAGQPLQPVISGKRRITASARKPQEGGEKGSGKGAFPASPSVRVQGLLFLSFAAVLLAALVARKKYFQSKRVFDIVGSIVILSLFLPVLLISAILIKIDSPGPVFIKQTRVGVNRRHYSPSPSHAAERRKRENPGSLFTIYKLRTMSADAEKMTGPVWARENDDRITKIGRVLRKTHLDEIPQFMNVLRGDMCIVGPRPERPVFINKLNQCIKNYDRRLKVKPGITGLAQVRYHYAASIGDAKKKLKYDLLYIEKMSPLTDIRILVNTLNMVVSMKGAR